MRAYLVYFVFLQNVLCGTNDDGLHAYMLLRGCFIAF